MVGFHFLSDEREIAVGMGGGIPMSIPLRSMREYYYIFNPVVSLKYFVRVVRAADMEYLRLCAKNSNNKKDNKREQPKHSNGLPVLNKKPL